MKHLVFGALFLAGAINTPALAQDEDETKLGWSGTGEFGYISTTGNSETEAGNAKLEFIYNQEKWRHRLFAAANLSSEDGEEDSERYQFEAQTDYKLSDVSYLFGSFRWDADKFGPYDPQSSLTAGYGRELFKTPNHLLKAEIGAGYRQLEERVSGETTSDAILRLLLDDSWQITENTQWLNRLLVESGSDNTFSQFNTALQVAMNAKFAVKLGYEIRNNSDIPPESTEKTDTTTTVNLVYNFR
jgi:putative salt-induced outer membrane protein